MHTQPDADALGASLGLAAFLKKEQHQVNVIAPTAYPDSLAWLPNISEVIVCGEESQELSLELIKRADIIFCVDFAMLYRINELGEAVKNAAATKVIIDHHLDMEDFADLVLWNPKATAATELVYQLIEGLGKKAWIDKDIAECLYAGILTDTGSFRNPNTTANVHHITANLIEAGADIAKVNKLVYDNNSLNKLKFLSFAISQRLVVLAAYNTAYFIIKASDSRQFNLHTGDTEGLVNYALSIKGVVLAALINEKKDVVCLSLRSVGNFPVNVLAKEYFEGGGHKNAAGGTSHLSLEETIMKFEKLIKHNQHALKNSQ
ncbi:MAG: bifunctional oligoribonuclease/PAP phosphatase NrnA [Bacteroidota bacterium]